MKYLLCKSQKNELSTADSWILPQVLDASKRVWLVNGQGEQERCHFCGLDENAGEFSRRKGHSREIDNRTFPCWTAIGVTGSRSYGYMCLEKTLCYYIIILGVLGTETEGNIHTHPYEGHLTL